MGRRRGLSREASEWEGSRPQAAAALRMLAVLAVIALALVFASSALASEPDTIAGTVTSAATKDPIQGVEVCAGRFVYEQKCVSTGVDGTYVVPAPAVPVHVEFNAPSGSGLVSRTFYNGAYTPSQATELTVPVGEVFTGIDEELLPEGRVEGVVANASTKAPIDGVEVCASPSAAWPEEPTCVSTNAEGVYEFSGLAPVSYTVKFKPGPLNYLPGTTANIDAALPEGAQVEGSVKSAATELPISGVQACATGFGPALETKCATTDAQGHYLIDGLETSSYYVSFWPSRPYVGQRYEGGKPMWVNQGETLSDIDASVLTGTTISGDVTSASTGEPMGAGEVEICLSERVKEEFDGMAPREETSGYCTDPNQNGEYQITGVATSTDQIEFRPKPSDYEYENQYWDHVGVSTGSTELHTTAGENITGIDAALQAKYGVITGTVIDVVSKAAIGEIWVCALQVGGSQAERCTKTDANGRYTITGLKSGEYTVEFYSYPSTRYPVRYYGGEHTRSEAQHVKVSAGVTTTEIDAELTEPESAGSHIRGVVSSASSGQPIAGIEVCAYDAAEEAGLFGRCATTEAGGEYSISGLSSGEYLVEFSSPSASGLNYVAQYYDSTESFEQAIAVQVGPETADIGIDAQMHEGGRIAGEVTDASTGGAIEGIGVCASSASTESFGCASTNSKGEYTISALAKGEYDVEFSVPPESALDYVRRFFDGQSSAKTATLVPVTIGETSAGINAKLQLGGRISGRVTAAGSGPLSNVLVCALSSPSEAVACALTGRNGEYAIAGVPAGRYVIGFQAAKPYKVQYYNDQATYAVAQPVQVAVGTDTSDIGAVMRGPAEQGPPPPDLPPPPKPVTPVPQQPVSSESGAGASPQPSPSTVGASTPTSTATPAPAQVPPVVTAPTSKIVISGSTAALRLSCSDATCRGTIELTSQVMTSRHEGGKTASHRETLVLARGSFSLAKGGSATAVLRLTTAGKQRLAQAKRHPLAAEIICSVRDGKTTTRAVMVS
jgi:Carboxypeptidase regulatory-like domain